MVAEALWREIANCLVLTSPADAGLVVFSTVAESMETVNIGPVRFISSQKNPPGECSRRQLDEDLPVSSNDAITSQPEPC